jgi:hypothetical protein
MRRSQHYGTLRDNVVEFKNALIELLNVMERQPVGISGAFYRWIPSAGHEDEYNRLRHTVGLQAGPAAEALAELGFSLQINEPPAFRQPPRTVNPILSWSTALEPPNSMRMEDVLDYSDRAIGMLDGRARQASAVERSLAGRVARLISFPSEVREAIGGGRAMRTTAFGVAVVVETLVVGGPAPV